MKPKTKDERREEPAIPPAVAQMYERMEREEARENALPAWAVNPPKLTLLRDCDDD